VVGEKYTGRLRDNYRVRRDNWKASWQAFKNESVTGAIGNYLRGVGKADRHLIHRRS